LETSLKKLNLEYVDLYLIHWPGIRGPLTNSPEVPEKRRETWRAFVDSHKKGKCKAIGVSNYTVQHLEDLLKHSNTAPHVNQVEYHPKLQQKPLVSFCAQHNIVLEAYSSLGQGHLVNDPTAAAIGKEKGKSGCQVLLRWGLQKGAIILPKSAHTERIRENMELFGWELTPAEMARLDALDTDTHFTWDPTSVV